MVEREEKGEPRVAGIFGEEKGTAEPAGEEPAVGEAGVGRDSLPAPGESHCNIHKVIANLTFPNWKGVPKKKGFWFGFGLFYLAFSLILWKESCDRVLLARAFPVLKPWV